VYVDIVWRLVTVSRGAKTMITPNISPTKHENIRGKAVLAEKRTNMNAQQNKRLMPLNSPLNFRYFSVVLHSSAEQIAAAATASIFPADSLRDGRRGLVKTQKL
jgi:hypothetical protein